MSDDSTTGSTQASLAGAASEKRAGTILCEVFRTPKKEGMYLYVERSAGLARVPEALLKVFGEPATALVFQLTPDRRLARADAREVLAAIDTQGFFLQMPPAPGATGLDSDAWDAREAADRESASTERAGASAGVSGGLDAH